MKPSEINSQFGLHQIIFNLPSRYGYCSMLKMAQVLIDNYFDGRVLSFRESIVSGMKPKEYKYWLWLYGNRIDKCRIIQHEHGVLYLKGKSGLLNDTVEFAWFNQTNILGVLTHYDDDAYITTVGGIVDHLITSFLA